MEHFEPSMTNFQEIFVQLAKYIIAKPCNYWIHFQDDGLEFKAVFSAFACF
jgi:hypothetical protein